MLFVASKLHIVYLKMEIIEIWNHLIMVYLIFENLMSKVSNGLLQMDFDIM